MTHNTEVEENIKNALVPWMESFGTKETFDKVITAIDSLHRRVAELESLAYAVAVDIDSEGKIITHHQLQKARQRIAERVRAGHFSKVANNSWNDENTFGYKEALKDVAEWLEDHSELDQDKK